MTGRDRRKRQPSNVFSMLTPDQIKSIKAVFLMIDQNKDEKICQTDIDQFLPRITQECQIKEFENIETNITFYGILSLLSDKFIGLNQKEKIINNLRTFSDDKKTISKSELLKYLTNERLDTAEMEYCLNVFEDDKIPIEKLTNLLRHGETEPFNEKKQVKC